MDILKRRISIMANELQDQNVKGTEDMGIVEETENYTIRQDEKGKYIRQAKYANYSSIKAATKQDKIWLFNLLEGESSDIKGMKEHVGEAFTIQNVITNSYDSIDEDTGEITQGVLTYLMDENNNAYVTSSKSVYFTVVRLMRIFGKPDSPDYDPVKVMITSEKGKNGNMIKLQMVE